MTQKSDTARLEIIEPTTEAGYRFRWLATPSGQHSTTIGKINFHPSEAQVSSQASAVVEAVAAGQSLETMHDDLERIKDAFSLPRQWSRPSAAARDHGDFFPRGDISITGLMAILARGAARLSRSDIVLMSDETIPSSFLTEGSLYEDLYPSQRDLLAKLKDRRGSIGLPVEMFWVAAATLGIAPDAEIARRYYSNSQFIPKIRLDGHLFNVEEKSLLEQLEDMTQQGCRGIVWVHTGRGGANDPIDPRAGLPSDGGLSGKFLHIHLEALTFDNPRVIPECLQRCQHGLLQGSLQALTAPLPHPQ